MMKGEILITLSSKGKEALRLYTVPADFIRDLEGGWNITVSKLTEAHKEKENINKQIEELIK